MPLRGLYLQPLIPPKRFDMFPPLTEGRSEGLGAFCFFFKNRCHKIDHIFGPPPQTGFGPFSFKFFVPIRVGLSHKHNILYRSTNAGKKM